MCRMPAQFVQLEPAGKNGSKLSIDERGLVVLAGGGATWRFRAFIQRMRMGGPM
jgi:hypothetical protein